MILHCSHNEFQKPCEFTSEIFQKSILLTSILKLYDSYCNIRLNPSNISTTNTIPPTTPVISNLVNNSSLQTGFMIGTSTGSATSIEVSLDNGAYQTAVVLSSWRFAFPTGSATWRDFSRHTISVRGRNGNLTSEPVTIRVTKLQNKDIWEVPVRFQDLGRIFLNP